MKLCEHFNFIFFVVTVILQCVSAQLFEGSECDDGICKLQTNCPPAKTDIERHGHHNFTRCGFKGPIEIVCCPSEIQTRFVNSGATRKSAIACANYTKNVPIFLNYQITGGKDAASGEFPHMAALGLYSESDRLYKFSCGATLITSKFLVTAAHCILNRGGDKAKIVRMGEVSIPETTNVTDDLHDYKIKKVTTHPNYRRRKYTNDIALIELEKEVVFGDYLRPACLYTSAVEPEEYVITGWGEVYWINSTRRDNLQKGTITLVPFKECSRKYKKSYGLTITDAQLCAVHSTTDSCQGDSGGPLQLRNSKVPVLVGITSIGGGVCGSGFPSIYTRIYKYLDWIEEIVWP